jgi:hypothetical protein
VLLQERRDAEAANRFFRSLLVRHGGEPRAIVTDKLRSYTVARRELIPELIHDTSRHANNRVDLSPADPGAGTGDEAIQIDASGATIRPRARCRRKSLQSESPFGVGESLSEAAPSGVWVLGWGSGHLSAIRWAHCVRLELTWQCPPA